MTGHNPSTGHNLPYTYPCIVIGHNTSTDHHSRDWLRGHVMTKMNAHVTGHNHIIGHAVKWLNLEMYTPLM